MVPGQTRRGRHLCENPASHQLKATIARRQFSEFQLHRLRRQYCVSACRSHGGSLCLASRQVLSRWRHGVETMQGYMCGLETAWRLHFVETLATLGAQRLRIEPKVYFFPDKNLYVMSYLGDRLTLGPQDSTDWLCGRFRNCSSSKNGRATPKRARYTVSWLSAIARRQRRSLANSEKLLHRDGGATRTAKPQLRLGRRTAFPTWTTNAIGSSVSSLANFSGWCPSVPT